MEIEKQQSSQSESSDESSCSLEEAFGTRDLDFGREHTTRSLCLQCGSQGLTKLLFLDVPKFHEIIVSSFKCKNCGFYGRDVQQAGEIQTSGKEITLEVRCSRDLERGMIKSSEATTKIQELGFEIPPRPMSGAYSTVEGVVKEVIDNLSFLQPERRQHNPALAERLDEFIANLQNSLSRALECTEPKEVIFTLFVSDPSGNSHIEPLEGLPHLQEAMFKRTDEEVEQLGLTEEQEAVIQRESKAITVDPAKLDDIAILCDVDNVAAEQPTKCPACSADILNKSLIIRIPYFKECLLMCATCDECGYKSVEISNAGAIPPEGRKTVFHVTEPDDLSRDVLKSDSCSINIPELGIELEPGTMGGVYTTLEGLITMLRDQLKKNQMFWFGDGYREQSETIKFEQLLNSLDNCLSGKMQFTIEIDDPLDGSFIKNVYAPDPDPQMEIINYTRTREQDEMYGLDQIDAGDE